MLAKISKTFVAVIAFVLGVGLTSYWTVRSYPTAGLTQVSMQTTKTEVSPQTLEMVFAIDTTGSMGGLIEGAKQRVWRIVNEVMQQDSHPDVRVGLVAYRDRGDSYVTMVTPLTINLDLVYSTLLGFKADGGGDTPEDVKRGLMDGIEKAGWSKEGGNVTKILFLVGDAPPHENYKDEPALSAILSDAKRRGIIINSIQCGTAGDTTSVWRQIAQAAEGEYFAIPQDGGVEQISTPYDKDMAALSTKLGGTFLAYGADRKDVDERIRVNAVNEMVVVTASGAASADRAVNKAINKKSYDGDLIQDIENGVKKLEDVKENELPDDIKKLKPEERKPEIEKRLAERKKIREQIMALTTQREKYLKDHKSTAGNGASGSFDTAVMAAVTKQMAAKAHK